MTPETLWNDLLDDVRTVLRAAAHPVSGTLSLSPEVAQALAALGPALENDPESPEPLSLPETSPAVAPVEAVPAPAPAENLFAVETPAETVLANAAWPELERLVKACAQCTLHQTRTQTVFGIGSLAAEVVFVGEAPGEDEDRQGEPFVGAAGRMLTDIIVKGMKMSRDEVYICNVLKCRPPNNRTPNAVEVGFCEPFLIRQLQLIHPKVICALGGVAAKTLLKTDASVGALRNKWHFYQGIPLRVTYHPSYLIRQEDPASLKREKQKVWTDIQAVLRVMRGEETPTAG